MINKRIISQRFPMKISTKPSISFNEQNPTISRTHEWFWIGNFDLWMKLIRRDFETIYFEMRSLFFCLIKRTKNQGFGIVVKAQISKFFWRYRYEALYFFHSWNADFVGDLLRSFRQKSRISVRDQNPTIPRPEENCELGFMNTRNYKSRLKIRLRKF